MAEAAIGVEASRSTFSKQWHWLRGYLPEGRGLPQQEWQVRHRAVLGFIFAHALFLPLFAVVRGWSPVTAIAEGALIGAIGLTAMIPQLTRKARSGLAAVACVMSSAILVQFWNGYIEGHFHFFVVVALIALYQDWLPFLLAIAFVGLDHGVTGTLNPGWVYNHAAAFANPWRWAFIHAAFVLAECVALVVVWKTNEQARAETSRILRSTGEGLLGVDAECRITFVNPAALTMAGRSETEIIGQPLYGLLRGEDGRPAFPPDILKTTPGAFSSQAWLARPTGDRMPVEVLCTPIEGHRHEEGAVVAVRDLTERLQAEAERSRIAHQESELVQLREVNSFKARFMNMAAHELNTPLTPIKMQMHLLKSDPTRGNGVSDKRSIQILDRNISRLSALVNDLLDSTRLQANRLSTAPKPIDFSKVLAESVESFRPLADANQVTLRLQVPDSLPCEADEGRIVQVIDNLLTNALKFTPAGGKIVVRAEPITSNDGLVRVAVTDTGIGLNQEQIERLFQPFEQLHDKQIASHQGSGLGLYIARGIIQAHNGRIWCESAGPGKGSSFIFEIPAVHPKPDPNDVATS
jgi:PAS domain S-box-containing protein